MMRWIGAVPGTREVCRELMGQGYVTRLTHLYNVEYICYVK